MQSSVSSGLHLRKAGLETLDLKNFKELSCVINRDVYEDAPHDGSPKVKLKHHNHLQVNSRELLVFTDIRSNYSFKMISFIHFLLLPSKISDPRSLLLFLLLIYRLLFGCTAKRIRNWSNVKKCVAENREAT